MRRAGGARVNLSKRVTLRSEGTPFEGWVLNISRGGVRLILEDNVSVGDAFAVEIGDDDEPDAVRRPGRVVWVQEEQDGAVVGLEFTDRPVSATNIPAVSPAGDASDGSSDPNAK